MANPTGKGGWQKGASGNPSGRPASSFQDYVPRAAALLDEYTPQELIEIASDKKKLHARSGYDAILIKNLANMFIDGRDIPTLEFTAKERERLLDRAIGKTVQRIGGEAPGEPIKVQNGTGLDLESLDSETLMAIVELLRAAKEKQAGAEA